MRDWYRASKISENKVYFVNKKTSSYFIVFLKDGEVVEVSKMHFALPKETGSKLSLKEQEKLFTKVKAFISSITYAWHFDGYQVKVCRSAAGYYIGCYCEDGPYCRLSDGYADSEEEAWCYFYEQYNQL